MSFDGLLDRQDIQSRFHISAHWIMKLCFLLNNEQHLSLVKQFLSQYCSWSQVCIIRSSYWSAYSAFDLLTEVLIPVINWVGVLFFTKFPPSASQVQFFIPVFELLYHLINVMIWNLGCLQKDLEKNVSTF